MDADYLLALIIEIEAAADYYNLLGRTWTGNVMEVAA